MNQDIAQQYLTCTVEWSQETLIIDFTSRRLRNLLPTTMSYLSRFCLQSCSRWPTNKRKVLLLPTSNVLFRYSSSYHATRIAPLPLKPGTPIKGLDIFKEKEPLVALDRKEYPGWVDRLATPLPSLAMLRRMKTEDADDRLQKRFLKLKRRMVIKTNNRSMEK